MTTLLDLGLLSHAIASDDDVEVLRRIRNRCAAGFSFDTSEISPAQQRVWWALNRHRVVGWLYCCGDPDKTVGYGLLRQTEDKRWWSSVAVLPKYAGQGFGKSITTDIIHHCPNGVVWATARKDNPAAVKLHDLKFWDIIDGPDERLVYFRTKSPLP